MSFKEIHPVNNLIFFVTVVVTSVCFRHPVYIGISFVCAFICSVVICGRGAIRFDLILTALVFVWTVLFSMFSHDGLTVLFYNHVGNAVTLESVFYGFITGLVGANVIMWFSCNHAVMTTDKYVYLTGRLSPMLALSLSMIFRLIPKMKKKYAEIKNAQIVIAENSGNIFSRLSNMVRIHSILITWVTESLVTTTESMKSRGVLLRGRRSFSMYSFDDRDRIIFVFMALCIASMLTASILGQVNIIYRPAVIMAPVTYVSFIFYFLYAAFCMLPVILSLKSRRI